MDLVMNLNMREEGKMEESAHWLLAEWRSALSNLITVMVIW